MAQQYLPDELAERRYYDPTEEGWGAHPGPMDELALLREQGPRKRRASP